MTKAELKQAPSEEDLQEELVNQNIGEILMAYGQHRAENANIGWTGGEDSICSKVYGLGAGPTMCVTTRRVVVDGKTTYEHTHEEY